MPFGPVKVWTTVHDERALLLGPPSSAGMLCWGNSRQLPWWPEQRSWAAHTAGCWSSSPCCTCPESSFASRACPRWTQVCERSRWWTCCVPQRSAGAEKSWHNWRRHRWRLGGSWSESRTGPSRTKAGGCRGRSAGLGEASIWRCRSLLAWWSLAPDAETDGSERKNKSSHQQVFFQDVVIYYDFTLCHGTPLGILHWPYAK